MSETIALESPLESPLGMIENEENSTQLESSAQGLNKLGGLPMVSGFLADPLLKKTLPILAGFFVLMLFILMYVWLTASEMRSLYPSMSEVDRSEAFIGLQAAGIPVSIDQSLGTLLVPSEEYYQARMVLAANGLPRDGSTQALDTLSAVSSITTSQFMEQAQYTATIESELSRSIERISTIKSARVHLAVPRQSSYIRNREPAKASVVVDAYPGRLVNSSQVQAIVNIVASSVPYLSVEDVSVVDQMGNLLTEEDNSGLVVANEQANFKRNLEDEYKDKITELLSPIFGSNNIRSDVDITVNFDEFETSIETFDRNGTGPLTRSEMLTLETSSIMPATGVPGAQTNIAPQDTVLVGADLGPADPNASGVTSSQTTRNYEVDREIQYQKNSSGDIRKLTVAVVLNRNAISGLSLGGAEEDNYDVTGIQSLVANAVGIDESRGDSIMVLVSEFMGPVAEDLTVPWFENESIFNYSKMGFGILGLLIFSVLVVRPVIYAITGKTIKVSGQDLALASDKNSAAENEFDEESDDLLNVDGEGITDGDNVLKSESDFKARAEETGESLEQLKARLRPKKTNISASMLDTANTYDDKVAIIRMLVEEDSSRVASLLMKMVASK